MKNIPMLDLKLEYEHMKADIDDRIAKCLAHQKWILGPEVKELEEAVAKYIGLKHCIGVSSGTEALVLSLRALAIKTKGKEYFDKEDEIVTTPFTFTATGDAILRAGATPVFIDIDPLTYNIDVIKLAEYLKKAGAKAIGILPVHLYGQACDMEIIMSLAKEHKLFVVEDVAQAFAGKWKERFLGSIGTTGCFSFFPSKNLGCFGDGGMISTDSDETAEMVRMLLKHGGKDKYNVDHIGYNARLDTIQAAVLLAKMKFIDEFTEKRRAIARKYDIGLKDAKGVKTPFVVSSAHHCYHQYTIRVADGRRDEMQKALKTVGIDSMVYYPIPLHKMKVFDGRMKIYGSLENAERASLEVLSLPVEPLMSEGDINAVVSAVRDFK